MITNKKPLILLFFLQSLLLIAASMSLPASHSTRASKPNDEKLLENTCKRTPNYSLCIQSLRADPASSGADITGLALIMVKKAMTAKANAAITRIHQLLRGKPSYEPAALRSCGEKYRTIVVADIPQAIEALQKGDPKFAEDGARDAANEAIYCEKGFSAGKSPLTHENNAMRDVAAVAAAIVRNLL